MMYRLPVTSTLTLAGLTAVARCRSAVSVSPSEGTTAL